MSNELSIIELPEASELFNGSKLDPILESIKQTAKSYALDVTTESGRKEIASVAYRIAKSKTAIDGAGKELVSGIKAKAGQIDAERRKAREFLDALKEEIRKPLTDFETAEKERVETLESRLANLLAAMDDIPEGSAEIKSLIERVLVTDTGTFQEYSGKAEATKQVVLERLNAAHAKAEAAEQERAELEKLRKEQEERLQKEREERLKAEAAKAAKREAEEKEAKRVANQKHRDKIERKHAEAIAKEKAEAAKAEAEKEAKRVANQKHRDKIEGQTRDDILKLDCIKEVLKTGNGNLPTELIEAIKNGQIRNLSIQY